MGAQLTHPKSVVWAIYGDGAFGYSLIEFDTFIRHKIPVIAIIGNDGSWSQIARGQVEILKDPVSTKLNQTKYHLAVEALGGVGLIIENEKANPFGVDGVKKRLGYSLDIIHKKFI